MKITSSNVKHYLRQQRLLQKLSLAEIVRDEQFATFNLFKDMNTFV